jgi:hypothetical protein
VFIFVSFTLPTIIARLCVIIAPLALMYAYLYMI